MNNNIHNIIASTTPDSVSGKVSTVDLSIINPWSNVKDEQPASGQEVFACYYDELLDEPIIDLFTYFRKGDVVENEVVDITDEMIAEALKNDADFRALASHANNRIELKIIASIFGSFGSTTIKRSGFYMWRPDEKTGLMRWRRTSEPIEYWMPKPITPYEIDILKKYTVIYSESGT